MSKKLLPTKLTQLKNLLNLKLKRHSSKSLTQPNQIQSSPLQSSPAQTGFQSHIQSGLDSAQQRIQRTTVAKKLQKHQFFITDNGNDNQVHLGDHNKIINGSTITFRRGNNNHIRIGSHSKFNNTHIAIRGHNNRIVIADRAKITGQLIISGNNLSIQIGENCTAISVYLLAHDHSIHIGRNCLISRGVEIRTSDVHKIYDKTNNQLLNPTTQDVILEDHIWIAANVTISKNVRIAHDCVIGAGAFVNKPMTTPHTVIAGSPAKIIKKNIRWER